MIITELETACATFLDEQMKDADQAHDRTHIERVVANAKWLGPTENADMSIVIPAAWLHDCVVVPKFSAERSQASRFAADRAIQFLIDINYPVRTYSAIHHAIVAHSFSANVTPETTEARVVQDADRLEALGAIGITRCLQTGFGGGRTLCHPSEVIPSEREPDEDKYTIDHFFVKLFKLPEMMQTEAGYKEALRRTQVMQVFVDSLQGEMTLGLADI